MVERDRFELSVRLFEQGRGRFPRLSFLRLGTDKGQRRSAVPEKDRLPAAKRAMCVSAQRRSGQAPVS